MQKTSFPVTTPFPPEQLGEAGLTAFFSIAAEWNLSIDQQRNLLGEPKKTTFFSWKKTKKSSLNKDTLDRISYLLGIYKSIHILFSDSTALEWIKNKNKDPLFNGLSPLEYMLEGSVVNLADVRRYLDWARG